MSNPITPKVRGVLYLVGVTIGALAVVVGPLILALDIPETWAAVVVSLVGAVTSLLSLLARDNLPDPDDVYAPQHSAAPSRDAPLTVEEMQAHMNRTDEK